MNKTHSVVKNLVCKFELPSIKLIIYTPGLHKKKKKRLHKGTIHQLDYIKNIHKCIHIRCCLTPSGFIPYDAAERPWPFISHTPPQQQLISSTFEPTYHHGRLVNLLPKKCDSQTHLSRKYVIKQAAHRWTAEIAVA